MRGLLEQGELTELRALSAREPLLSATLVGLLLDPDELVCWRAIEGLGALASDLVDNDLDRVRDLVRRQFWAMTDESGNIPWRAPEVIGELLLNAPPLASEFVSILTSFSAMYPFSGGVHWALAHLARSSPGLVREQLPVLTEGLSVEDARVRGYAAVAMGLLCARDAGPALEALAGDTAELVNYDFESRELRRLTVGELAREALARLSSDA